MLDNNTPNKTSVQNNFIDILVNLGYVDRSKLLGMETKTEEEIVKFLQNGLCTKEQIAKAYSSFFNLPFVSLKDKKIDKTILKMISKEDALNFQVVSYSSVDKCLELGLGDPKILKQQPPESLKKLVADGYTINLSIVSSDDIQWAINQYNVENKLLQDDVESVNAVKEHVVIENKKELPVSSQTDQPKAIPKPSVNLSVQSNPGAGVSNAVKLEEIDLLDLEIPKEVLLKFPSDVAKKYKMVVFETVPPMSETKASKKIKVALLNPNDAQSKEILEFIKKRNNIEILKYVCNEESLNKALSGYEVVIADKVKDEKVIHETKSSDVAKDEEVTKSVEPLKPIVLTDEKIDSKEKIENLKSTEASVIKDEDKSNHKNPETVEIHKSDDDVVVKEIKEDEIVKDVPAAVNKISQMQTIVATVLKTEQERIKEGVAQPYTEPNAAEEAIKADIVLEVKAEDIDNNAGLESSTDLSDNMEENNLDKFLSRPVNSIEDLQSVIKSGMVPEIVAATVSLAIVLESSDIHIEATAENVRMRFRIDGILKDVIKMPLSLHAPFVSRIKIMSKLKIDEQRVPQDGRFDVISREHEIDLRVSTLPTIHGEKVVMRILDKSAGLLTLEDMGITGVGFDILVKNIKKPYGVVLATGPTGSGKSTTLYAVLQRISTNQVNVITLEDPVEYEISGINQVQVKPQIGFTFAEGLRSVLRQDPNIVMVGEIRDLETAAMTTHAALTGHLVLSTLHTNDSAGALPRLINMGVEPFLITSSVNCIVAQRLVRKICSKCKEKTNLPPALIESILKEILKIPDTKIAGMKEEDLTFFHGKGCPACTNGYHGRMGIYEVLEMNEKIESLAVDKRPANEIAEQACKDGMITMKQDGILKALKGITTIDEVLRVTTSD